MTDALLIFDERTKWVTKKKNWLFKFHGNLTALLDGPQHLVSFRETSLTSTHGTHPPPPFAPPPLNLSAAVFSPTSGFTMLLMATGYPPLNFPRINGKP